jgi:hypothetical protein
LFSEEDLDKLFDTKVILHWHGGPGIGHLEILDCDGNQIGTLAKLSPRLATKALHLCEDDKTFDAIANMSDLTNDEKDLIKVPRKLFGNEDVSG